MPYQERAHRIATLLEEKLGMRGATLEKKVRRAGRLLPRRVRAACDTIIAAERMQCSPKLARMVDDATVSDACRTCENYLEGINAWDRKKGRLIGFFATTAFNVFAVIAALIAVLVWRGYL